MPGASALRLSRPAGGARRGRQNGSNRVSTGPVLTLLSHGKAAASGALYLPHVRVITSIDPQRKNPGLI
jgi:hypothetical protein